MRWRVGVAEVAAALVVAVVIAMPPREAKIENAFFDHINLKPAASTSLEAMAEKQARLATSPTDAKAADEFAELLASFGQTDDALRVAGIVSEATKPDNWRALLTLAAVHADRIEFQIAKGWTDKALAACKATQTSCRGDAIARIKIFADELDRAIAALAAGHNPRTDPKGFREAVGEKRLPPVRVN